MEPTHPSCPQCGALLDQDNACPACNQATPADKAALLEEIRALRELQSRAMQRIQRLETLLDNDSHAAPAPVQTTNRGDAVEFTFQEAEPDVTPTAPDMTPAAHDLAAVAPDTADEADEAVAADAAKHPSQTRGESPSPAPPPGGSRPFRYGPGDRPASRQEPPEPDAAPHQTKQKPAPRAHKPPRQSLESTLGQKWLLAAGVAVMVFGLGYFLKYTFAKGWIGPSGQLALGYAFSALLLGAGEWTRRRGYALFGLWILGGGMASVYFATFAGHRILELMAPGPAFGVLAAATIATVALAVLHNAPGLAVLGLLGGYATPFMLEGLGENTYFLLGFVTVLNAGMLAMTLLRRWQKLNWLGLAASYLIFAWWYASEYIPQMLWNTDENAFWAALAFMNLTFLGYATAPLLGGVLRPPAGRPARLAGCAWLGVLASYFTSAGTWATIYDRSGHAWAAPAMLGYALVFAGLAWLAYGSQQPSADEEDSQPHRPPGLLGHIALLQFHGGLYFLLATPLALNAHWVTAVLALQGGALYWLGQRTHGNSLRLLGQAATVLAFLRLFFLDLQDSFGLLTHSGLETLQGALYTYYGGYASMLPERWGVIAAVLGALGLCAWLGGRESVVSPRRRSPGSWQRLFFGLALFALLSMECAALFGEIAPAGRSAAVSALWALFATGLLLYGFRLQHKGARVSALVLYGVTLFKVVLVDMEDFATPYRIVSFLVLGGLLIGGSFLYHRYNLKFKD